ncbi:GNAT family N-acetyltransferase [Kineococcus sp. DHX-1]|uniref:GNAT family N-acetyltransferase n=1 Tax=Kineococcus sp. DHX-1 TaxID=3349638 RepID=UPI0036D20BCA
MRQKVIAQEKESLSMVARMATESDVEAISRICSDGYRRTYPGLLSTATIEDVVVRYYRPERIQSEVAPAPPGWSGYLVAQDESDRVVAAGGGGLTGEGVGEVFVLYVDPDRRGLGFGTAVLDLLTRQQVDAGAVEQWVSVQKGNTMGIPFYEARGFEFVEEVTPWDGTGAAEGALTWRMKRSVA